MKKFFKSTKLYWVYWIVMLFSIALQWFDIITTSNDIFFYIIYFILAFITVAVDGIKGCKKGLILLEIQFIIFAFAKLLYSGTSMFVIVIIWLGNYIFANEVYGSGIRIAVVLVLTLLYPVLTALAGNLLYRLRKRKSKTE